MSLSNVIAIKLSLSLIVKASIKHKANFLISYITYIRKKFGVVLHGKIELVTRKIFFNNYNLFVQEKIY